MDQNDDYVFEVYLCALSKLFPTFIDACQFNKLYIIVSCNVPLLKFRGQKANGVYTESNENDK